MSKLPPSRAIQRIRAQTQKPNAAGSDLQTFLTQQRAQQMTQQKAQLQNPIASCGNCGQCSMCCLPGFNCANAAGDVQNANVQTSVGWTGNCIPDVHENIQVNSLGVCVQPVNFSQAAPVVSVIDSCAGNQTDTVILPEGGIYNTNISNNQPMIGIPGVFCNTCGQCSTNCACSGSNRQWFRAGVGAHPKAGVGVHAKAAVAATASKSAIVYKPQEAKAHKPQEAKARKPQEIKRSELSMTKPRRRRYKVEYVKKASCGNCNTTNTCCNTCNNCPNCCTCQTCPCPNCGNQCNNCCNTCNNCSNCCTCQTCPNCGNQCNNCCNICNNCPNCCTCQTCPPNNCCNTCPNCGNQCNNCCNTCNNCPNCCTCQTCPNVCPACNGCGCIQPCSNLGITKITPCQCNFVAVDIGEQAQCDTCGFQTACMTPNCGPMNNCGPMACAPHVCAKKPTAKAAARKPMVGAKALMSVKPSKSKKPRMAGCNCPCINNCAGCGCGNCGICPFGCVNSFATMYNPCSNVNSTLEQVAPLPAGQVPCPPENLAFCNSIPIPTVINTWYQSWWDYWGLWGCVNDIPMQFQQTGYLPASLPNTGVYSVALSGSGFFLAVAYETGINQYAGIDIYSVNYNTFNRIQTIIPMPTDPQCGFNPCATFNVSMSFSNDGTVLAVGMPKLGASGTLFIFRLVCGKFEMQAEVQPGALPGPKGTTGNPQFAYSVWVSGLGQRVVVGCPMCPGGCGNGCSTISGSVVTFRPCVDGTWVQEQIITPQGNNSFIPFLINGVPANANPYQLFATNPSGLTQSQFGRSVATDTYSNNIVVGSNNVAFVFGNVNPNQATITGNNYGAGALVGNTGPFALIATLSGIFPNAALSPNYFDQGIAVAISGDGLTVATSSIAGSGPAYPIVPAAVFVFRRNPLSATTGNGAVATAYTQIATLTSNAPYLRAGSTMAQAGLWISFDGTFIIAGDPNYSILGAAPDGIINAYMETYCGWINYYSITGPVANSCLGTSLAVNLGLSTIFVAAPNIANANGSTGTVVQYT